MGSDVDDHNIKFLLRAFNFKIFEEGETKDLDIENMIGVLKRFASFKEHENRDCCIVVIMSHGEGESLCATDWSQCASNLTSIRVEWILELFQANNCVALATKPKLFFVQACRGSKVDCGITSCQSSSSAAESKLLDLTLNEV